MSETACQPSMSKSPSAEKLKPLSFKLALSSPSSMLASAGEREHAYHSLVCILNGLAGLLGIENPGMHREFTRLFNQASAPPVGGELRVSVVVPGTFGKARKQTKTAATRKLVSEACSAEALSTRGMEDPTRRHLLAINAGISSGNYSLRLKCDSDEIFLANLGPADRSRRDLDWQGECLLELTDVHYRKLTMDAVDHRGKALQLRLRTDENTFASLVAKGHVHLRLWGRGFSNSTILRLDQIYEYDYVDAETFIAGRLLTDDRDGM